MAKHITWSTSRDFSRMYFLELRRRDETRLKSERFQTSTAIEHKEFKNQRRQPPKENRRRTHPTLHLNRVAPLWSDLECQLRLRWVSLEILRRFDANNPRCPGSSGHSLSLAERASRRTERIWEMGPTFTLWQPGRVMLVKWHPGRVILVKCQTI